jgi:hypothetical protein
VGARSASRSPAPRWSTGGRYPSIPGLMHQHTRPAQLEGSRRTSTARARSVADTLRPSSAPGADERRRGDAQRERRVDECGLQKAHAKVRLVRPVRLPEHREDEVRDAQEEDCARSVSTSPPCVAGGRTGEVDVEPRRAPGEAREGRGRREHGRQGRRAERLLGDERAHDRRVRRRRGTCSTRRQRPPPRHACAGQRTSHSARESRTTCSDAGGAT